MDSRKAKVYLNWSGGKDCSMALLHMLQSQQLHPLKLLTSCNAGYERVSMHGVRITLMQQQADALGLPLQLVKLDGHVSMEEYNRVMKETVTQLVEEGYTHAVFGDIFLEDLRLYREQQLASAGVQAVFPLWKRDTAQLAREFISLGFKAKVVCVNAKYLDESFAGREYDLSFLRDLPGNVDPCGENGEFHTFVYDGPVFSKPIPVSVGEKVFRTYEAKSTAKEDQCFSQDPAPFDTGFWYADLLVD